MSTKLTFIGAAPTVTTGVDVVNAGPQTPTVADQNIANLRGAVDGKMSLAGTSEAVSFGAVTASGTSYVLDSSSDYYTPQLYVGDSSSPTTGKQLWLGYNSTADCGYIQSVHNGTAYTNLLLNTSGGNVLIGTTADNGSGAKLQVAGSGYFTGDVKTTGIFTGASYPYATTFGSSADVTTTAIVAGSGATNKTSIVVAGGANPIGPGTITFSTATTTRAVISDTGLSVTGGISATGEITASAASHQYVNVKSASANAQLGLLFNANNVAKGGVTYESGSRGDFLSLNTNTSAQVWVGAAKRVHVDATGLAVTGGISASGNAAINCENGTVLTNGQWCLARNGSDTAVKIYMRGLDGVMRSAALPTLA